MLHEACVASAAAPGAASETAVHGPDARAACSSLYCHGSVPETKRTSQRMTLHISELEFL